VLLELVKSGMRRNPSLYRWSLAVRRKFFPDEIVRCAAELSRLMRAVAHPVFVKVAGDDSLDLDPFAEMIVAEKKWIGLVIEPNPFRLERLKLIYEDLYRFSIDQVAVDPTPGHRPFFCVSDRATEALSDLPYWHAQIGSFDRRQVGRCLGGALEPFIVEDRVRTRPLPEILARHAIERIDFLHIDAKGDDLGVWRTMEFATLSPAVTVVELGGLSASSAAEIRGRLQASRYAVRNCGSALFALKN
jgi:hypothetical protein